MDGGGVESRYANWRCHSSQLEGPCLSVPLCICKLCLFVVVNGCGLECLGLGLGGVLGSERVRLDPVLRGSLT